MADSTYTVTGMACGHCADAVTEELERVPGVAVVSVDVETGRVSVASEIDLDIADVRAAVEAAGYELAATGS